jgi:hypothetical protein
MSWVNLDQVRAFSGFGRVEKGSRRVNKLEIVELIYEIAAAYLNRRGNLKRRKEKPFRAFSKNS